MEYTEKWRALPHARRTSFAILAGGIGLVIVIVVIGRILVPEGGEGRLAPHRASASVVHASVAVAGDDASTEMEASWPGELVSLGNVSVQPSREGMIAEWYVYVGERVAAGQVLGMLSAPPQMPDTLAMLADEEKMLAMARVNTEAKRAYARERLPQLEALRENVEDSLAATEDILGSGGASASSLPMIEAKRATIRAILRSSLVRMYPIMSGQETLPARWNAFTLKDAIGIQDSRLRDTYQPVFLAALAGSDDAADVSVVSGLAYFDLAIRLADASIPDGSMLTNRELAMLKEALHMDQEKFIMAVDDLREVELMAVDTRKMAFEQLKMIDNDIAMLKQDLTMAEGDMAAKEVSVRAIKNASQGGALIIAPKSGIVSAIMKKPGEYVMPGTSVAMVTGSNEDALVRFRIPVNAPKPMIGELLSVVRTGYSDAPRTAKVIGIGNALDEGGAIMADAILSDGHDWPAGAAVRVLAPTKKNGVTIAISSIWWNANGIPNIWAVSDAGRIYAKAVVLGRTLGESVEVIRGLGRGDRYIAAPTPEIEENMLVGDLEVLQGSESSRSDDPHAGHANMPGMEM